MYNDSMTANNSQDFANMSEPMTTSERMAERKAGADIGSEMQQKARDALSSFCRHGLLDCEPKFGPSTE
jgi:hypothetical protein